MGPQREPSEIERHFPAVAALLTGEDASSARAQRVVRLARDIEHGRMLEERSIRHIEQRLSQARLVSQVLAVFALTLAMLQLRTYGQAFAVEVLVACLHLFLLASLHDFTLHWTSSRRRQGDHGGRPR